MPLPASLTVVNVRGTFLKNNGDPAEGHVEITSIEHLVSTGDNTIVEPVDESIDLDEDGFFEIDLPATNDPQWAPVDYTYTVKEVLTSGVRTYRIAVPYDTPGGVLQLADISPVQSYSEPTTYVLVSTANQLGGYPRIDAITGKIPSSVIPAGGGEADGSFKGTWSGASAYITGDTVIRSGSTYGAIQDSTNKDPVTETAYWTEYATSSSGTVTSVNGETGVVVLTASDVGADPTGTASAAVAAHVAASDPHGDRAFATGSIAAHAAASDPHADRAFATAADASHVAATDPHADRAYADALAAGKQPLNANLTTIAGLASTTNNMIQGVAGAWASRTPTQVKAALSIAVGDVSGAAPTASPTFTGTATAADLTVAGRSRQDYETLTDAATIVVDASLGNQFTVTLGDNRTLGNPSNAVDGQKLFFRIRQDGTGGRTLALDTKYRDPNGYYTGVDTAVGGRSYLGVVYDSTDDQFDVIAFVKGY